MSGENDGKRTATRGRPAGQMTHRRQQIFDAIIEAAERGEVVSAWHLARRCGIYDYRNAKRIVRDLKRLGRLA